MLTVLQSIPWANWMHHIRETWKYFFYFFYKKVKKVIKKKVKYFQVFLMHPTDSARKNHPSKWNLQKIISKRKVELMGGSESWWVIKSTIRDLEEHVKCHLIITIISAELQSNVAEIHLLMYRGSWPRCPQQFPVLTCFKI